ncbi:MAG: M15 family metallopeptidase [Blastocatellia bacterium]
MIRPARSVWMLLISISFALNAPMIDSGSCAQRLGTLKHPIIDSAKEKNEVFDGLDARCPEEIRKRQRVVKVLYYSFDDKIHQGQLVIDRALEDDIQTVFQVALRERFPIHSVIPISDRRFRKDGRWDDDLSMAANNTSGFNYRQTTGGTQLSNHAFGRAIDINPLQNPYVKEGVALPPGAKYDPSVEGTLTATDPIVRNFQRLGWKWGGEFTSLKDYQHFEKPKTNKVRVTNPRLDERRRQ